MPASAFYQPPASGHTRVAPPTALRAISGPAAWLGADLARRDDWIRHFSDAEIAAIEATVRRLEPSAIDVPELGPDSFAPPELAGLVADIQQTLRDGRGFILLRGLPLERWSRRAAALAYFGLSRMLGELASQNALGHILGHVKDLGRDYAQATERGYQTSARLSYHSDASDIVGLLCLQPARAGGKSSLVASATVYNRMLAQRPDLVAELCKPVYRDRRGEVPAGADPWYAVPVFNPMPDGRLVTAYVRSAMRKAQRFAEVPRSTPALEAACDLLDAIAGDPEVHLQMDFRVGDIQYLNNHTILHSRTAFEDFPEPERRRHLWRIWVACRDWPALPECYTRNWQGALAGGRPAGIRIQGVPLIAPLDVAVPLND